MRVVSNSVDYTVLYENCPPNCRLSSDWMSSTAANCSSLASTAWLCRVPIHHMMYHCLFYLLHGIAGYLFIISYCMALLTFYPLHHVLIRGISGYLFIKSYTVAGFSDGLGRDFSVLLGLGWTTTNNELKEMILQTCQTCTAF